MAKEISIEQIKINHKVWLGGYVKMEEQPTDVSDLVPTANTAHLYTRDKAGVSGLYWRDDAGVEHDLGVVVITDHGALTGLADDDHPQYALDTDLTTHAGAVDPHAGYRLESADHSHASTGAQAGQLDHGAALTGLADNDHPQYLLVTDIDDAPVNGEVAQPISSNWAFDHAAAADPHAGYATDTDLSTHAAAADPHTGYVKEADASWIDLTDTGETALHSHAATPHPDLATHDALGLATDAELATHVAAADPHTGYVREADANWVDLTDAGETTLHSHAAAGHPDLATHDALGLATDAELATHAGAADPHTGYRLESADHTHATTGLQGGTIPAASVVGANVTETHAALSLGGTPTGAALKAFSINLDETLISHNSLGSLTSGDVHTQYPLLAGRSGGQTLIGGTAASNPLNLTSTSHATKGDIVTSAADITLLSTSRMRMAGQNRFRHLNSIVSATKVTDQTGIAVNTWTDITFDTEDFDTDTLHDASTNTNRITFPIAGKWLVTTTLYTDLAGATAPTKFAVRIQLNAGGAYGYMDLMTTGGPTDPGVSSSTIMNVAANDYATVSAIILAPSGTWVAKGLSITRLIAAYLGE